MASSNTNYTQVRNFNLPIQPFSGDPEVMEFFFSQIKDISDINHYGDKQAIAYLKAHLSGPALKYYIEEPYFKHCNTLKEIEQKFNGFFKNTSTTSVLSLHNFMILPSESVKSMAHRLNSLIAKVYPTLKDINSINEIKFSHFIAALPHDIKITLLKENITKFDAAVDRAQALQDILISTVQTIPDTHSAQIDKLNAEINSLSNTVNLLTHNSTQSSSTRPPFYRNNRHNSHKPPFKPKFQNRYQKKSQYFPRNHNNNGNFCTFCGRQNHIMKNCREFLAVINPKPNNNNNRYANKRNSNTTNNSRFPNPHATPFNASNNNNNDHLN